MKKVILLIVILIVVLLVFFIRKPYRYEEKNVALEQEISDKPKSLIRIIEVKVAEQSSEEMPVAIKIENAQNIIDFSVLNFYRIKGINFSQDQPFAMIQDVRTSLLNRYQIGDSLENWELAAINRKEVILENQGMKVGLMFEMNIREGIIQDSNNEWTFTEKMVIDSIVNLDKLTEDIFNNNQLSFDFLDSDDKIGVTVEKVGEDSILKDVGLEEGDKITKINGKDVDSFDIALDIANKVLIEGKKSVEVEIQREGTTKKLQYRFPEISAGKMVSGVFGSFFSPSSNSSDK